MIIFSFQFLSQVQHGTGFHNLYAGFQVTRFPPAPGHAGLGKGEGQEHPDGIQRDQAGDAGLKDDDQQEGRPARVIMPRE